MDDAYMLTLNIWSSYEVADLQISMGQGNNPSAHDSIHHLGHSTSNLGVKAGFNDSTYSTRHNSATYMFGNRGRNPCS